MLCECCIAGSKYDNNLSQFKGVAEKILKI